MKPLSIRKHRRKAALRATSVSPKHPLLGTWEEDRSTTYRTTVIYTIWLENGGLCVAGTDEEDGTGLEISRVKWDGDSLRFTSFYPPGEHKARHVMRLQADGNKLTHVVSGTYADGERFSVPEVWAKRRSQKKRR